MRELSKCRVFSVLASTSVMQTLYVLTAIVEVAWLQNCESL